MSLVLYQKRPGLTNIKYTSRMMSNGTLETNGEVSNGEGRLTTNRCSVV